MLSGIRFLIDYFRNQNSEILNIINISVMVSRTPTERFLGKAAK